VYFYSACIYLLLIAISITWGVINAATVNNPANEFAGLIFWSIIFFIPVFRFFGRFKDRLKYGSPMITDSVRRQYPSGISTAFLMLGLGHACTLAWLGTELFAPVSEVDRITVHLGIAIGLIFYFIGFNMIEARYRKWLRHG
jgi:hypothetical protein